MCEAIEAMIRKEVNAVRKEVETLARKEISSARKDAAKAQKELAEFKTESPRRAFNMMSHYARDLSRDEIIRMIAENFHLTADTVRKLIDS